MWWVVSHYGKPLDYWVCRQYVFVCSCGYWKYSEFLRTLNIMLLNIKPIPLGQKQNPTHATCITEVIKLLKNFFFMENISPSAIRPLQFKALHSFTPNSNDVPYSFDFGKRLFFFQPKQLLSFLLSSSFFFLFLLLQHLWS